MNFAQQTGRQFLVHNQDRFQPANVARESSGWLRRFFEYPSWRYDQPFRPRERSELCRRERLGIYVSPHRKRVALTSAVGAHRAVA